MKTESKRCRLGIHKWVFRGDDYTVTQYHRGEYEMFCLRCELHKPGKPSK